MSSEVDVICYKEIVNKANQFDPNHRYKNVKQFVSAFNKAPKGGSFFKRLEDKPAAI